MPPYVQYAFNRVFILYPSTLSLLATSKMNSTFQRQNSALRNNYGTRQEFSKLQNDKL